jgi:hypothetical protein
LRRHFAQFGRRAKVVRVAEKISDVPNDFLCPLSLGAETIEIDCGERNRMPFAADVIAANDATARGSTQYHHPP